MRHGNAGRAFSRTSAHRSAMLANVVTSLLKHERIRTTVPKAKEARKLAEKMITFGKKGTLHARRLASKTVKDPEVLGKVFDGLAQRYSARAGGYTRIVRLGFRKGDAAEMALLELVDRPVAPAEGEAPTAEGDEKAEGKAKKAKAEKAE